MAVLNLTPDSFYAPSRLSSLDAVLERAATALDQGADILDLGAESTRPGAAPLPPALEQQRLLPILSALRRQFPSALLSADTRHASTARLALDAGADIINDVSGLDDPAMPALLAHAGCGAVLMHHRGEFATMHRLPPLADPLAEVLHGLRRIVRRSASIAPARIVLDPGFGFGINLHENFPLLARLDELHALGFPLLVGLSRKSFLAGGDRAAGVPPEHRLPASLAAATAALLAGAHLVRAHDVSPTVAVGQIVDRLLAGRS